MRHFVAGVMSTATLGLSLIDIKGKSAKFLWVASAWVISIPLKFYGLEVVRSRSGYHRASHRLAVRYARQCRVVMNKE
jgi:hypothetical protein